MEQATNLTTNLTLNDTNDTILYPDYPHGQEIFLAYNLYLYVMIAFGVVGNFIVLVVFIRHPPSTTTDWFIIFITVYDFISSFINVPVYATFTNGYWRLYGTTLICRLHMFISQSLVLSSSFLISGLALDRYIKVCRQSTWFSKAKARNACLIISIVTTLLSTPCFVMFENRGGRCVSVCMDTQLFVYYLMVFIIFIFATTVVVFSYYKVAKTVLKSEQNILSHKGRARICKMCCCFLPAFRQNQIGPVTATVANSKVCRETQSVVLRLEVSANSNTPNDMKKARLQIPSKTHNSCSFFATPLASTSSEQQHQQQVVEPLATSSRAESKSLSEQKTSLSALKEQTKTSYRLTSLRTTRISFLVCSVFIITWIPPWLCFILASIPSLKSNIEVIKFMIFGRMIYLINGMTNPIIYTWLNRKFRHHILEIFCRRKV